MRMCIILGEAYDYVFVVLYMNLLHIYIGGLHCDFLWSIYHKLLLNFIYCPIGYVIS